MYKSLIELVNQYTENKGGLRSKLVVSHELEQDVYAGSNYLPPDYRELIWEIHPGTLNIGDRLGEGLSFFKVFPQGIFLQGNPLPRLLGTQRTN